MKNISKILCCLLVVLFCMSMMACSRETIVESWISVDGDETGVSDAQDTPEDSIPEDDSGDGDTDADSNDGDESSEDGVTTTTKEGETTKKGQTTTTKKGQTTTTKKGQTTTTKKGQTTTTKKGQTTTTKKGQTTTTTTAKATKTRNNNNTILRNISVQSGSASNYGTTFKGKSYTMITWAETTTDSDRAEIAAFANKYGCTIKIDTPNFEQVRSTMATKLSSGYAYDIVRLQGSWYPRVLIANLMAPLDGAFTTGDCISGSSTKGIDLDKSKYFAWNNKLYGMTTYDDSPIYFMYYNKKFLNGNNDPWKLYKEGNWTWAKMKELAESYKGPTTYWSDQTWCYKAMVMSNNVQLVKETNTSNGVKLETSISNNTPFIHSLQYVQGMNGKGTSGDALYKNSKVLKSDGASDKLDNLLNGNIVVWPSESNRYQSLYNRIAQKKGSGFDNKVANLGVAPLPYGPDNSAKAYAAGWLTGFGAGRGSDATAPKLVAALTIYHSENAYTKNDSAAAKAEKDVKTQMNEFYKKTNYCDFGYGDADGTLDDILTSIERECANGTAVATVLKKYDSKASSYLKNSLSQQ